MCPTLSLRTPVLTFYPNIGAGSPALHMHTHLGVLRLRGLGRLTPSTRLWEQPGGNMFCAPCLRLHHRLAHAEKSSQSSESNRSSKRSKASLSSKSHNKEQQQREQQKQQEQQEQSKQQEPQQRAAAKSTKSSLWPEHLSHCTLRP